MAEHQALFNSMCKSLIENDFATAADLGTAILERHGNHTAVRHNLALAHECSKDFVAAAAEYNATIRDFPQYMPSYLGLANCSLYAGDSETAEQLFRTAKDIAPEDPRPSILLSEVLFLRGKNAEAITEHLLAVRKVDASRSVPTQNHVHCYMDFGDAAARFHMFLERSLVQREGYPTLPPPPLYPEGHSVAIFLAHTGNAADLGRRLERLDRRRVYLLALDDISAGILKTYGPDATTSISYDTHELPAIALFVAHWLTQHGTRVCLLSDDARRDIDKLEWADTVEGDIDVSPQGDLVATPAASAHLDPRLVSPMWNRCRHPEPDAFFIIYNAMQKLQK